MLKIKAIIVFKDRTATINKVKVSEDSTSFSLKNMSYTINETDGFLTGKRRPIRTFLYNTDEPAPINPFTKTVSAITPARLNKALEDNTLDKLLDLTKPRMDLTLFAVILLAIIVIVGGFFIFQEISNIKDGIDGLITTTGV